MKIRDIMSTPVIRIHPEETVTVAARMLERSNIGALPVCGSDGRMCGLLTDRDIVTRCLAAGRSPSTTAVREIMTTGVVSAPPDMELGLAAGLMGRRQIRRLPILQNRLNWADTLKEESSVDAGDALTEISDHLSSRF